MWLRNFGVVIATVIATASGAGCGGQPSESEASSVAPVTVAADATYTQSEVELPLESIPVGLSVSDSGDLYVLADEGLMKLSSGAAESEMLIPGLPWAYGFVVTAAGAVVGNLDYLQWVDLTDFTVTEIPVANVSEIWALAADRDGNVYLTGSSTPDGRVIKFGADLADPVNVPFPGLSGNSSMAVGPDGSIYVVSYFDDSILVLRPGSQEPEPMDLGGVEGVAKVATTPAGDVLVLVSDEAGSISTEASKVRLVRYAAGSSTPQELAEYVTDSWLVAAGNDGAIYYTAVDDGQWQLRKLTPQA